MPERFRNKYHIDYKTGIMVLKQPFLLQYTLIKDFIFPGKLLIKKWNKFVGRKILERNPPAIYVD